MAIYVTGDTHGLTDFNKVKTWYEVNKDKLTLNDYLIICGDVNVPSFYGVSTNNQALYHFEKINCTILFVDGNHENFTELNKLEVATWNRGKVHPIGKNMYHLMRGQIYNIDGLKFLTIGGATSPDKEMRIEGYTWFREEDISYSESDEALKNLEQNNNKVDYIITHTIGREFIYRHMSGDIHPDERYMGSINNFLDYIDDTVSYKKWYFGHFHMDIDFVEQHKQCLYNSIVKITD